MQQIAGEAEEARRADHPHYGVDESLFRQPTALSWLHGSGDAEQSLERREQVVLLGVVQWPLGEPAHAMLGRWAGSGTKAERSQHGVTQAEERVEHGEWSLCWVAGVRVG